MSKLHERFDKEIKVLKEYIDKGIVILGISKTVLSNLFHVSRIILKQDIDELKAQQREEEAMMVAVKAEMDEFTEPEKEIIPEIPPPDTTKMIGTNDPNMPARMGTPIELDPKNFIYEVPEERIKEAHLAAGGGINMFTKLLFTAEIFRQANLEPIFLTNKGESIIRVSAREIWGKPNVIN